MEENLISSHLKIPRRRIFLNWGKKGISVVIFIVLIAVTVVSVGAIIYISTRPRPDFQIENLSLSANKVAKGDTVTALVEVTNVGNAEGIRTVRLKVENETLKKKVTLGAGESRTVSFDIEKRKKGTYSLSIGGSSGTFEVVELAESIIINPENSQQVFDGFGTSLCWWAHMVGGWDNEVRNDIIDLLFDNLEFNIVRYNIGGGQNPNCPWNNHMMVRARMPGFKPKENGVYDWTQDKNQRWCLRKAINHEANRLIAFSNSPPWWMTKSKCAAGATDGRNNLMEDYYDNFANYLVRVLKYFNENRGITFDALAPFNEPSATWWKAGGRQEGCHFSKKKQNLLIKKVGSRLESEGLPTMVDAPEESHMDTSVDSLRYYDEEAMSYISHIATHAYGHSTPNRKELRMIAEKFNKRLYMSEYDVGFEDSSDPNFILLAEEIAKDLNAMAANGWVLWQAVEPTADVWGGPGWGLLAAGNFRWETYNITKKFYSMANYSKFVEPGTRIIRTGHIKTTVAHNPEENSLVIVQLNNTDSEKGYMYDVSEYLSEGWAVPYRTSFDENLAKLPKIKISNGTFIDTVPKMSVTTYKIKIFRGAW